MFFNTTNISRRIPAMNILDLAELIGKTASTVTPDTKCYDSLLSLIGDARFVLLGEATHGTKEFYHARAAITKRLIREKGFSAVAVEADFPDALRVNRYVLCTGNDSQAIDSLGDFKRFPKWMWRNTEVLDFVQFLRNHNSELSIEQRVGFYGLDLYSMYSSIDAVVSYLQSVNPDAAQKARKRYECFEQFGKEEDSYGTAMSYVNKTCQNEAIAQLTDLYKNATAYVTIQGFQQNEELFYARQNARLAIDAEQYYREMFSGRISSWNLRDRHMADTIEQLSEHQTKSKGSGKIVVWEHNSHIGDARATDMSGSGELSVGQIMREKHGHDTVLVGFTTYDGTVSAATNWGGDVRRKNMLPALHGSYEDLFRHVGDSFYLNLRDLPQIIREELKKSFLQRAIGVIYMPQTERVSHYYFSDITSQFDAIIHFTTTNALVPLEQTSSWIIGEIPQTYGSGL
jgi:erythromycin esterase-like protein